MNTDLIIVGGGAAGLMAGVAAGEAGIRTVVLERKHHPGRKLLMCGNNRCNLTFAAGLGELLDAYGEPVAEFLRPALTKLPPAELRRWFAKRGLRTRVHQDQRVFPRSEKAADVLHLFTDCLRRQRVPLVCNCPVEELSRRGDGFLMRSPALTLAAPFALLATGGVSYPKTGSVGDGQRFAHSLGHRLRPYRPGLVGFELDEAWMTRHADAAFPGVAVRIVAGDGVVAVCPGEVLVNRWGAQGPAMVNASRIVARRELADYVLQVDLAPRLDTDALAAELVRRSASGARLATFLADWLVPRPLARGFVCEVLRRQEGWQLPADDGEAARRIAAVLKAWPLRVRRPRPLKEAMVTVGGVDLTGIDSQSMASTACPGLYFAGEVMDVDGPTGGFNLQAAFATAQLAVSTIAARAHSQ